MIRTYLELNINERINLKSWWAALPLAYLFKNGFLKRDADIMFSDPYIGGRTAQIKMESPQFGTYYKGMSAEGERFLKSWERMVKFGCV